jgi:hypothetical protein
MHNGMDAINSFVSYYLHYLLSVLFRYIAPGGTILYVQQLVQ